MLKKFLISSFVLLIVRSKADDCSEYFQYFNENGEKQGIVRCPAKSVQEHKLTVKLTVKGQITTVSLLLCGSKEKDKDSDKINYGY